MNNNPLISIICPVYNAANYLKRCVGSIINQSYTNWELVLIDDGSKDESSSICDEFSEEDRRIRVIHKKNEGVSLARQVGIDNSRGEWVIHIDSDDWVESTMLEEMLSMISDNVDMVISDYYLCNEDGNSKLIEQNDVSNHRELLKSLVKGNVFGSLWNKLVKRSLYEGLNFKEELTAFEDQILLMEMGAKHPIRIKNIHKAFYHYVIHNTSLSQNPDPNALLNVLHFEDLAIDILNKDDNRVILEEFVLLRLPVYSCYIQDGSFGKKQLMIYVNRFPQMSRFGNRMKYLFMKSALCYLSTISFNKVLLSFSARFLRRVKVL